MTGFNHTLAGSIIGIIIPLPFSPIISYALHFVMDVFPHFGRHEKITPGSVGLRRLIIIDGALSAACLYMALVLFPEHWLGIGLGAFFAVLPDFQWIFKDRMHTPQWFLHFSSKIQ